MSENFFVISEREYRERCSNFGEAYSEAAEQSRIRLEPQVILKGHTQVEAILPYVCVTKLEE